MSIRQKYGIVGALGGALLGYASMKAPTFIVRGMSVSLDLEIMVIVGLTVMGAFFGVMTANARPGA